LKHFVHTSFISRKVGFSRRCPHVQVRKNPELVIKAPSKRIDQEFDPAAPIQKVTLFGRSAKVPLSTISGLPEWFDLLEYSYPNESASASVFPTNRAFLPKLLVVRGLPAAIALA
jgi:hypothetical protein